MVSTDDMMLNKERLYESSSLRDDLNDAEATVLLEWGESQLERLAQDFPEEFEQKARFLRQLLKNINRFVGQREFNEIDGQQKYMSKISMYLEPLGWAGIDEAQLFEALPEDKADMAANLAAILRVLSPDESDSPTDKDDGTPPTPDDDAPSYPGDVGTAPSLPPTPPDVEQSQLENSNPYSINQPDTHELPGANNEHGEEQTDEW
ncbi:MAG: hypothetical protein ACFE0Q_01925 [Anaerolineae bacterium]